MQVCWDAPAKWHYLRRQLANPHFQTVSCKLPEFKLPAFKSIARIQAVRIQAAKIQSTGIQSTQHSNQLPESKPPEFTPPEFTLPEFKSTSISKPPGFKVPASKSTARIQASACNPPDLLNLGDEPLVQSGQNNFKWLTDAPSTNTEHHN